MRWLDELTTDKEGFRKRLHQNVLFNTIVNDIIRGGHCYSIGVYKDGVVWHELYFYVKKSDLKRNTDSGDYCNNKYLFSSYGMQVLPNGVLMEAMAGEICHAIQPYYSERLIVRPWERYTPYRELGDLPSDTTYGFDAGFLYRGTDYCYAVDAVSVPRSQQLRSW